MDQHTDRHPHRCRQHHGQQRPPAAAGLPADGEAGGAAGEVQQAQGHHTQGRLRGPAAVQQNGPQRLQPAALRQRPGVQIAHQQNGQHDLIGGKPQQKGQQHHAIQPHEPSQRRQYPGGPLQQRDAPGVHVPHPPDQQPRRGRHRQRPSQHKHRPIQQGAHQHPPHLGQAIGRQLQRKKGGLSSQHRGAQQLGHGQRHGHAEHDDP